jgi:broad specificity phosphatase PhoE
VSLLHLVRHGQASFFAANYDQLSPLGQLQAQRLGEFLANRGTRFDAVFTGPAVRQRTTTEIVLNTMTALGHPCPEPVILEGLNEHSGDKLLSKPHAKAFFENRPELAGLERAFRESVEPDDVQKNFQKLFEAVVLRWTSGDLVVPGVEMWQEFHNRARKAIESIIADPARGRTVLAVSSVGPISVAVQTALKTSIPVSLDLGWRLRNASVTTFLYSHGRVTLDSFNSIAHLANLEEITYR